MIFTIIIMVFIKNVKYYFALCVLEIGAQDCVV